MHVCFMHGSEFWLLVFCMYMLSELSLIVQVGQGLLTTALSSSHADSVCMTDHTHLLDGCVVRDPEP